MDTNSVLKKMQRKLIWFVRYLKWTFISNFSKKKLIRFILEEGKVFDCPLQSAVAKMMFFGNFEKNELAFFRNSLRSGQIFLDIGANVGIYTIIASKLVGDGGHVYSFEPSKRELEILNHNIKINHLENITVIEKAISAHSGIAQLAMAKDGGLNSFADTHRLDQQIETWQTVETISLDEFIQEYSIQKVDFIKIDVEGAEKLVFQGASQFLASDSQAIILFESSELNVSGFGYSVQEFLTSLSKSGLSVFYLDQGGLPLPIVMHDVRLGKEIYNFVTEINAK
jgi:FkbM family methyltransferase